MSEQKSKIGLPSRGDIRNRVACSPVEPAAQAMSVSLEISSLMAEIESAVAEIYNQIGLLAEAIDPVLQRTEKQDASVLPSAACWSQVGGQLAAYLEGLRVAAGKLEALRERVCL